MKKLMAGLVVLSFACVITVFAEEAAVEKAAAPAKEAVAKVAPSTVYVCAKCDTCAMKEGKCAKCGADMAKMNVVSVKDGTAMVAAPGAEAKDAVKVSLKGMYVCGCGADCKCNVISDKEGKCGCGKDMKKVE